VAVKVHSADLNEHFLKKFQVFKILISDILNYI
jgi:hypothetical protein